LSHLQKSDSCHPERAKRVEGSPEVRECRYISLSPASGDEFRISDLPSPSLNPAPGAPSRRGAVAEGLVARAARRGQLVRVSVPDGRVSRAAAEVRDRRDHTQGGGASFAGSSPPARRRRAAGEVERDRRALAIGGRGDRGRVAAVEDRGRRAGGRRGLHLPRCRSTGGRRPPLPPVWPLRAIFGGGRPRRACTEARRRPRYTLAMATDDDLEIAYYRTVEDLFATLRGVPHILSPKDFHLLRQWWRDEVPLAAVRAGITEVFAKRRERGEPDPVVSLSYCRHAVKTHARRIAEMHVGASDEGVRQPEFDAEDALRSLESELNAAAESQRDPRPPPPWERRTSCPRQVSKSISSPSNPPFSPPASHP